MFVQRHPGRNRLIHDRKEHTTHSGVTLDLNVCRYEKSSP